MVDTKFHGRRARGRRFYGESSLKISIAFDPQVFETISISAATKGISFAEQTRRLVNAALKQEAQK